jgi:hypothetical protein
VKSDDAEGYLAYKEIPKEEAQPEDGSKEEEKI